jgi:hypothetical protein
MKFERARRGTPMQTYTVPISDSPNFNLSQTATDNEPFASRFSLVLFAVALVVLITTGQAPAQARSGDKPGASVTENLGTQDTNASTPEMAVSVLPTISPSAPIAQFANGLLTIRTQGLPLNTILQAVRTQTGIAIDLPPGGGNDRVYGTIGPAPMREALVNLFEGSSFNYVMQGASSDPNFVKSVLLVPRTGVPASAQVGQTPPAGPKRPALYGAGYGEVAEEEAETPQPPITLPVSQPAIPASTLADLQRQAAEMQQANPNMTRGQILGELQKHHGDLLDQQAPQ